jgi:DNA (cytosine-5)-methyltransferase 1
MMNSRLVEIEFVTTFVAIESNATGIPFSKMKTMKTRLRALDLFSGIGGFSLGLHGLARTVAYCEIDEKCRSVLQKNIDAGNLDDAPIFEDVRDLNRSNLAPLRPELITAGFPCQDISLANNEGRGLQGPKSSLVFQILRIAREVPGIKYVLLENSPMIIHKGLPTLLSRVQRDGFSWAWGIFSAKDMGAPHERKRWYCLLWRKSISLSPLLSWNLMKLPWTPNWSRDFPVSKRVTPMVPGLYVRHAHLGNSVVPQVVHLAMKSLAAAGTIAESPSSKADTCETTRNLYEHIRVTSTKSSCIAKNDLGHLTDYKRATELHLIFPSASGPVVKSFWWTPLHSRTNFYKRLHLADGTNHNRMLQCITTQLMHEEKTVAYLAKNYRNLNERHLLTGNPQFTEWLMGYPTNWTLVEL